MNVNIENKSKDTWMVGLYILNSFVKLELCLFEPYKIIISILEFNNLLNTCSILNTYCLHYDNLIIVFIVS